MPSPRITEPERRFLQRFHFAVLRQRFGHTRRRADLKGAADVLAADFIAQLESGDADALRAFAALTAQAEAAGAASGAAPEKS